RLDGRRGARRARSRRPAPTRPSRPRHVRCHRPAPVTRDPAPGRSLIAGTRRTPWKTRDELSRKAPMSSNVAATADKPRSVLPRSEHLSGPQKLMILVLSMTLYGGGDIVANVVPEVQVGPLELGVSYFAFIAVV